MPRPKSDIVHRIARAARARFLAEGVDGASLRRIASEAGTSIGMVYYYFPTKDDLFLAVVDQTYSAVLAKIEQALSPDVDIEARIGRLYRTIGALTEDEVLTLRLVVREVLVSSKRLDSLLDRVRRGHVPLVLATLGEGLANGRINPTLPLPVLFLTTLALGAAPQLLGRLTGARAPFGQVPDPDTFASELVHVLFHGIGAKPAATAGAKTTRKRKK